MWEHAIGLAGELLLHGFSRVQRCSVLGRSLMSLDLTYVENLFKAFVPEDVVVNLRVVDTYIKVLKKQKQRVLDWRIPLQAEWDVLADMIVQKVRLSYLT